MPHYPTRIRLARHYEAIAIIEAPDIATARKKAETIHDSPIAQTLDWRKVGEPVFVYAHVNPSDGAIPPPPPPPPVRGGPVIKGGRNR